MALLDEDGVKDALRDGRREEGAVEEEDDEVGLGEDERDRGDEGCARSESVSCRSRGGGRGGGRVEDAPSGPETTARTATCGR